MGIARRSRQSLKGVMVANLKLDVKVNGWFGFLTLLLLGEHDLV
jgi:hypothetical protein